MNLLADEIKELIKERYYEVLEEGMNLLKLWN